MSEDTSGQEKPKRPDLSYSLGIYLAVSFFPLLVMLMVDSEGFLPALQSYGMIIVMLFLIGMGVFDILGCVVYRAMPVLQQYRCFNRTTMSTNLALSFMPLGLLFLTFKGGAEQPMWPSLVSSESAFLVLAVLAQIGGLVIIEFLIMKFQDRKRPEPFA